MLRTLRPGDVVDRYTIESLLGEGGMAAVYAVRHNTLGSNHALKLLKIEAPSIRDRLIGEGQAQASLRHPNIVAVTDVLLVDGQPGLLMERIDGPSMDVWLEENRPSVDDALKLFRGVLAGVARAHRAGLVHRDLKPGNILLDGADGLVIPKVADFGLAKVLAEDGGHAHTRTGYALGTPQFMAPEQIRNAKDVDQRADVFALGCILYVLVCGRLPFEDPDLLELYNRIATGRYQPPESLVPGLPESVRDTIRGCLEVDRERRIPDCDAIRARLYGEDDALAGGVKLAGTVALRPARRAEALRPAETRVVDRDAATLPVPTAAPPRTAAARPAPADGDRATVASPRADRAALPAAQGGGAVGAPLLALGFAAGALLLAVGMAGLVGGLVWSTAEEGAFASLAEAPAGDDAGIAAAAEAGVGVAPTNDPAAEDGVGQAEPGPEGQGARPGEAGAGPLGGADPRRPGRPAVAVPRAERVGSSEAAPGGDAPAGRATGEPDAASQPATAGAGESAGAGGTAAEAGRLAVSGEVESFALDRGGASYAPGDLPAGIYTARYRFPGKREQTLSGVVVRAGEETRVACDSAFSVCRVR